MEHSENNAEYDVQGGGLLGSLDRGTLAAACRVLMQTYTSCPSIWLGVGGLGGVRHETRGKQSTSMLTGAACSTVPCPDRSGRTEEPEPSQLPAVARPPWLMA